MFYSFTLQLEFGNHFSAHSNQGLLMTLDISIVQMDKSFYKFVGEKKNTVHFVKSLSNLLWKRGNDGKGTAEHLPYLLFLKKALQQTYRQTGESSTFLPYIF